jgi:hypothetical protein
MTVTRPRLVVFLVLAAFTTGAVLALLTGSERADSAAAEPQAQRTPGRQMILRPHDVGRHYVFLNFGEESYRGSLFCGHLHPATPAAELAAWLASDKPRGCFALFGRFARHVVGSTFPSVVGSAALDAGSEAAAVEGLALADELLSEAGTGETPKEVSPPGEVGDETRALRFPRTVFFPPRRPAGTILARRSGDVLAAVFVEGNSRKVNNAQALRLARLQQRKRIEHPSPFHPKRGE